MPQGAYAHNQDVLNNLPEQAKVALNENASPKALEMINKGDTPMQILLDAGIGSEGFTGGISAFYHEMGAVYLFHGTGTVILDNQEFIIGHESGDGHEPGAYGTSEEYNVVEAWQDDDVIGPLNGIDIPVPAPTDCGCNTGTGERYFGGYRKDHVSDEYIGTSGIIEFPQFTPSSFSIITSHVSLGINDLTGKWFETYAGQWNFAGGACHKPVAAAYTTIVIPCAVVWNLTVNANGNTKKVKTRTFNIDGTGQGFVREARMYAWDLNNGDSFTRIFRHSNTDPVFHLCFERETMREPCYVQESNWTYLTATYLVKQIGPNTFSDINWTSAIGAYVWPNYPGEMVWTNSANMEYKIREWP